MLYNASDDMNAAQHIRALVACPSCKSDNLRWEAASIECATCGKTFAVDGETPVLLAQDEADAPRIAEGDRALSDRLPQRLRAVAVRLRPVARPLLTHRSHATRDLVPTFVAALPAAASVLNVGAGERTYGPNVVNLDIAPGRSIHVVGIAEELPFRDGVFDAVVFQAVLEHVRDASAALREIARVLRPGGSVLVEVPFIQGYHPTPGDYRRFTVTGLKAELERQGFEVEDSGIAVGPASAMAWVAAEYLALLVSGRSARAYRIARILTTWLAWPLKWSDAWLDTHEMAHVIASGVWAKGVRPHAADR